MIKINNLQVLATKILMISKKMSTLIMKKKFFFEKINIMFERNLI